VYKRIWKIGWDFLGETEALDQRIEELKNELKRLIRFQADNKQQGFAA